MSGICGIVRIDGRPVPPGSAAAMTAAAPYRGRDGTTEWGTATIQVAHQATHIAPEALADQPLIGADGRYVLVGALRLDGRDDLARQLGPGLAGASDASLVMAAYGKWGTECARYLVGDYAFAIVDTMRNSVFLVRDPLGIRSLYYRLEPRKRLVFATEAAQVLAAPDVPAQPFEPAIAAFLAGPHGRPEWSFYEGILQLPAGCTLEVDETGNGRIRRFWDADPQVRIRYETELDYAEHFRDIFLTAVADRLRASGPLGIQLSGGMDSGSTASAAGHVGVAHNVDLASIRTYSWAFRELADSDERSVSDHIVRAFGFTAVPVFVDDSWPLANFPDHGPVRDDPFVLPYTAAGDAVRRAARQDGVRLLLVAQSGDEVVGTQWVVDYMRVLDALGPVEMWSELRSDAAVTDEGLPAAVYQHALRPLLARVKRRLAQSRAQPAVVPSFPLWIRRDLAERSNLPDVLAENEAARRREPGAGATRRHVITSLSRQRWATDLERRHAMAGLGYSDPFADRRVVDFVLSIPQVVVNRPADSSKRLLRAAMKGIMPPVALGTAEKLIPASLYARGLYDRGRPVLMSLTDSMRAAEWGYVDEAAARSAIENWRLDNPPPTYDPWRLVSLEWWLRNHW